MKQSQLYNRKRMIYFIVISIVALSMLTGIKLLFSYHSTSKSAQITLAKQYTGIAEDIANGLDKTAVEKILLTRADDENRKKMRQYLEEYREHINALYVYVIYMDESDVLKALVVAAPPGEIDFPIGFPCTLPAAAVQLAKQGQNYYTGIMDDELVGSSYMSIGVPFFDDNGDVLGAIGIDINATDLGYISKQVIKNNSLIFGMDILFAFVLLSGVYLLNKWYKARLKQNLKESEKMYISELGKIMETIKSSRHDLMNHLQVLNGLMDIRMYDKAHDYLKQLTIESKTLNLSLRIKNPYLLVLFQSKWELAHSKNIHISYETEFNEFSRMESMDLVKLFSNLLDNAIEAVESSFGQLPQEIRVFCKEVNGRYIFTIENPAVLADKEQSRLFQTGFTTKGMGMDSRGNGLSIVKRTVEKYKGDIYFQYEDGTVLIQITI